MIIQLPEAVVPAEFHEIHKETIWFLLFWIVLGYNNFKNVPHAHEFTPKM